MANVTIQSTSWYNGSTTSSSTSATIGYESSVFRTCVVAFTVDSSATSVTLQFYCYGQGTSGYGMSYNNVPIYASVTTSAYYGQGSTSGTLVGTATKSYTQGYTWTATISGLILSPGKTYYLNIYPGLSSGTYGWVVNCAVKSLTASGSANLIYIDNGSSLDAYQIYIDNGSSWDLYAPYIDNGSSWDAY